MLVPTLRRIVRQSIKNYQISDFIVAPCRGACRMCGDNRETERENKTRFLFLYTEHFCMI